MLASKLGFTESPTDPCPLHKKDVPLCLCVDDCGLEPSNRKLIDDFVDSLKKPGIDSDIEDNFEECPGTGTEAFSNGT